jgi:hypothetical protein
MAFQPTYKELLKYWAIIVLAVMVLGAGAGKLGQAKLESTPSMLIMDQQTKSQIVNRLDQDDKRIDKLDNRITTVEKRVDQIESR